MPPVEFTDIYDARLSFRSRNMLDHVSISALKERDIAYNLLTIYVLKDADSESSYCALERLFN
jgi:hypothetical protein